MIRRPLNIFVCHASGHPTDVLPHGDGLLALAFIRRLAERGHQVHVALDRSTISQPLPPNVVLHRLNPHSSEYELSVLSYMIRARSLFNRLRKTISFDLIHQLNPAFTGISLALTGTGVPCVIGPYAGNWLQQDKVSLPQKLREQIRMRIRYFQQKHASAILAWNRTALVNVERTGAMGIPGLASKLFIVPPGIDTEVFSPGLPRESDRPTILFLANIVRRKGIYTLIEAFDRVASESLDCRLEIAGDGPELEAVRQRVAQSPHHSRVHFLGRVEREEIPEVIRRCDVYCLPSYGEPFGMTALEAMACGKPVVVTNAGGLAELVTDEGGRKAAVGNAMSLAEELLELLKSPNLRRIMGEANRRTAVSEYGWPRVIDRLEEVYRTVTRGAMDHVVGGDGILPTRQLNKYKQGLNS